MAAILKPQTPQTCARPKISHNTISTPLRHPPLRRGKQIVGKQNYEKETKANN
jgi:hypothetical protein